MRQAMINYRGSTDGMTELSERLIAMRAELIAQLARDGIDSGMMALLASVDAAIEAVDRVPIEAERWPGGCER
jgi:hypothetical protein